MLVEFSQFALTLEMMMKAYAKIPHLNNGESRMAGAKVADNFPISVNVAKKNYWSFYFQIKFQNCSLLASGP